MAKEEGHDVTVGDWIIVAPDNAESDQGDWVILAPKNAERDQDHVAVVTVVTTFGILGVPVKAETTVGEIRQKVHEWKPEYSLERIELVCRDNDGWDGVCLTCSRPRADDETVKFLWNKCDIPGHMMQMALWIKDKNEETGEWETSFWKAQMKLWRDEQRHSYRGK